MATMLYRCKILPSSPNHVQELTLPLTFFDIPFLLSDPDQNLFFFDFPYSKSYFLETILPSLKKSLSSTLSHFLPLAGNIILPSNSGMPVIRYVSGDSLSLTVVQSYQNFSYLTGNHQRVADEFYPCVPHLPPATTSAAAVVFPVIAIQITLFPLQGICIGLTFYHAAGDASSIVNFMNSWALVNRFGEEFYRTDGELIPVLERNLVQDPGRIISNAWNLVKDSGVLPVQLEPTIFPTNKVRSTFLLTKNHIRNLKNYVFASRPKYSDQISSFAVITAHIWTCLVKSDSSEEADNDDDEPIFLMLAVDCRSRLNPPLPASYFGNCVVGALAESRRGLLKKKGGFLVAVESIAEAIQRVLRGGRGIVENAKWPLDLGEFSRKCLMVVAGSPRFDMYAADFGWGRPRKFEFVHLDRERSVSLGKSREFEGGFEVGLSRNKVEMEVFAAAFHQGLHLSKM